MPQLPSVSELMVGAHLPLHEAPPHLLDPILSATSPRLAVQPDVLPNTAMPYQPYDATPGRAIAVDFQRPPPTSLQRIPSYPPPPTPYYGAPMPQGDYFSYRRTSLAPPHFYLHPSSVSVLLTDSLRRLDPPSPAADLPLHVSPRGLRPLLFSHGSKLPYQPQVLVTPSYNLYTGPTSSPGGMPGLVPYSYGLPPLGQAVPYGVLVGTQYGPVIMGPGPAPAPVEQPAEQNNALLNKRRIIKRRTRTGCLTCRKRRIKCDERKPHCFNCERSKKLCLGYEVLPLASKRRNLLDDDDSAEEAAKPRLSLVYDLL